MDPWTVWVSKLALLRFRLGRRDADRINQKRTERLVAVAIVLVGAGDNKESVDPSTNSLGECSKHSPQNLAGVRFHALGLKVQVQEFAHSLHG